MTRALLSLLALLLVCSPGFATEAELKHSNLGKGNLAVSGYDVVSYFADTGPQQGKKEIAYEYEGVAYQFASEANRERFKADPERYIPAFGGWCAWAMLEGEKTKVNPETYKLYDGRLFLYYDGFWGDTRELWNEKAATELESQLAATAERNWERILSE